MRISQYFKSLFSPKTTECPVCKYQAFYSKTFPGSYDICPICGWEDDNVQFCDPNFSGGANDKSLNEAIVAFKDHNPISKLVPQIRPAWVFESYSMNTCMMVDIEPKDFFGISDVFYAQYDANLAIAFGIDNTNTIIIVRHCDIKEWNIEYELLLEVAKNNILNRKPFFTQIRKGVYSSTLNNVCDSGLMLLKDEILQLEVIGNPMAFFLSRSCLLITGDQDFESQMCCMSLFLDPKDDEFLTTQTYVLKDNHWVETVISGDNKIAAEYALLSLQELEGHTNEFLESLENIHVDVSDNFMISRMGITKKDDNYFTYAQWTEAEISWLPKVDIIILCTASTIEEQDTDTSPFQIASATLA